MHIRRCDHWCVVNNKINIIDQQTRERMMLTGFALTQGYGTGFCDGLGDLCTHGLPAFIEAGILVL